MKKSSVLISLVVALFLTAFLTACGQEPVQQDTVKVGALKGPTTIGLIDLMQRSERGSARQNYEFSLASTADELSAKLSNHELDIALLPTVTAALLAEKTNGQVQAIDINTLNTLYGVSRNDSVDSLDDLAGKTVYMSGKGTTPEYVIDALLEQVNLEDSVHLEFCSEPQEAISKMSANQDAVAILPEPFATVAVSKIEGASKSLDIGTAWSALFGQNQQVVTALTVADSSFITNHPEKIQLFLDDSAESVDAVLSNPAQAATQVVAKGIISSEEVAQDAIPTLGIACITGQDMKNMATPFYEQLFHFDPESLGGHVPDDSFYYVKSE